MSNVHLIDYNKNCKDTYTGMKMATTYELAMLWVLKYPLAICEDFLHDRIKIKCLRCKISLYFL